MCNPGSGQGAWIAGSGPADSVIGSCYHGTNAKVISLMSISKICVPWLCGIRSHRLIHGASSHQRSSVDSLAGNSQPYLQQLDNLRFSTSSTGKLSTCSLFDLKSSQLTVPYFEGSAKLGRGTNVDSAKLPSQPLMTYHNT